MCIRPQKQAICACIVMLATQVLPAAHAELPHREQTGHPTVIRDVALDAGGTLQGTIISVQGIRSPHSTVMISQERYVAETRSDSWGEFKVSGLRGGLYLVAVDGVQRAYRMWAPGTAPPHAINELLIVGGSDTVRGQLGSPTNRQWLTENVGQIAIITTFIALPIVYATKPFGS